MFNILGILVALIISSAGRGQGVMVGWESAAAACAGVLAVLLFHYSVSSHLVERWQTLRLRQMTLPPDAPDDIRRALQREREQLLRRTPHFRLGVDALILSLFAAQVYVFGWADYVTRVWGVPLYLDVLPILLPYFVMLAASWVGQYRIERHIRGADMRPVRYFAFQTRANLMTILPILLIYTAYWAVLRFVPYAADLRNSFEFLEIGAQLVLVVCISFFVPVAVRMILPGGPMPDGPLRRRLETFAKDRGLRVNQILVWRTGSRLFATAFVIGLVPPFRYVFFTDSLLKRMNDDEILAVFAHELGHVHHRHLWWLLAFILSFTIVMLGLIVTLNMQGLGQNAGMVAFAALITYAYFLFGYISRRFERQADAFAARHTNPQLISSVLLRLGMENPTAMKRHGWRHFSLERRIKEIMLQDAHPEIKRRFAGELFRGVGLAIAVTLASALLLAQPIRDDTVSGLATFTLYQFHNERESRADPQRLEELRASVIQRSAAMAPLKPEYEASAYWYEGQVQILTGRDTDAFDRMAEYTREQHASATGEDARRQWERWEVLAKAGKAAAQRARDHNTSFESELSIELSRRGYSPLDG